jgi:hypothetical protein
MSGWANQHKVELEASVLQGFMVYTGAGACTRIQAIKHFWDLGDARLAEPDAARFLSEAMG